MSLENQVTRVSQGMKDTLKTLINKLGGNVTDELIDQYPELAASLDQVDTAGSAAQALSDAKKYTDQKISEIPTPDVSGQINTHNTDTSAHSDIRTAISDHATNADIHVTVDEKSAWNDGIQLESLTVALPCSAAWTSVVYGNGKFVAVGVYPDENDNQVYVSAYSTNGVIWTQGEAPLNNSSGSPQVAYGNGVFVAIGGTSRSYSTDGITWNIVGTSVTFSALAYGNGKFVLYGSTVNADDQTVYVVQYSEDGVQWNQVETSLSGNFASMAYGNGRFVGICFNSKIAAYSEDGISWTATTLPSSAHWRAVAYGNGHFVVLNHYDTTGTYVEQNTTTSLAAYSDDGITWKNIHMGVSSCWWHISYGNGRFVAVGTSTGGYVDTETSRAAYSDDGLTWVEVSLPAASYWRSTCYGNGKFVALSGVTTAFKSKICAYSEDGATWYQSNNILQTASGTDVTAEVKEIIGSSSSNVPHASTHATGGSDPITPASIGAIPSSDKGKAGGVATLDSSGKVPSGQIPSLEYAGKTHASQHATGGSDPITPASIGAASKNLVESSLTIPQNTEDPASYLDNLLDEYIATKPNGSLGYVKIQCQVVHPTLGGGQYIASVFVIMQDYVSIEAIAYAAGPANNVVRKYTRSKSNGVWGEWTSDNAASYRPVYKEITLSASAWNSSAKTQTVTVSGVLADETKQLITPTPALASQTAYYEAVVLCTGQAAGQLTFTAKKIPTDDLTVYVTIQEVGA